MRAQLLVEEVLQLERAAALLGVGRVERRLGVALLERGDDRGRVADRAAVHLQHREGRCCSPRVSQKRDRDVHPRQRRAADVRDPLVVQRPARLLAEVRDVDLPESRFAVAHCAASVAWQHRRDGAPERFRDRGQAGRAPGWERAGEAIAKEFERGDFVGSVKFVSSLVEPAEAMNHHPDLEISWATVTVTISTHSEGGLTAADFELAAKIDALA